MDLVSSFINFAEFLGSFLCFQWEEATFSIDGKYFPVCSGCFGIYLGALIGLSFFPLLKKSSRKLFSLKYSLAMLLPMTIYWIILNIEQNTGTWIIPGIKEVYCFLGVLFGATISNVVYNLGIENRYGHAILKIGRRFWILSVLLILVSLAVLLLYPFGIAILFVASLIFISGFFGLVGFVVLWIVAFAFSNISQKNFSLGKGFTPTLTVLIIFIGLLLFQILISESRTELVILGLLFGALSFWLFGRSLRTFTLEELGIVKKDWKEQIFFGILIGLILYAAFVVYNFILSGFQEVIFFQLPIDYVGVLVIFVIVVSEEFFFRGYAIPMLERQVSTIISCVISSILFSIHHQSAIIKGLMGLSIADVFSNYEYMLILFVGGLLLSFLFVKKRSLIMPIVVHFFWNILIFSGIAWKDLPIFPS